MTFIPRKRTIRKRPSHHEEALQMSCVQWFRLAYPKKLIFHVPNGGKRGLLEAVRLKRMGVTRGVPDIFILEPAGDFHGLMVELKAGKNRLTIEQADMLAALSARGYKTEVARSLDEFQGIVGIYFGSLTIFKPIDVRPKLNVSVGKRPSPGFRFFI